jgi:hypothetical protein
MPEADSGEATRQRQSASFLKRRSWMDNAREPNVESKPLCDALAVLT